MLLAQQCVAQAELRARVTELELLCGTPRHRRSLAHRHSPPPAQPAAWRRYRAALVLGLIDSAPVAIYHADATSTLSYVNPEYRRIFGLGPEQSADDWAQGVHPEDRKRIEETWADFCRRPRPMRFEYRTQPTTRAPYASSPNRWFPPRTVSGYVGTISDFTDLVTARGDLRKAETLFRNTFDQAPIGIAYCGSRRQNPALQRRPSARCSVSLGPNSRTSPSAN